MTTSIRRFDRDGSISTPADPIEVFVTTLERCGANFTIVNDDDLRADLDGLGPPPKYADAISAAILALSEPIKDFITLRSVEGPVQ